MIRPTGKPTAGGQGLDSEDPAGSPRGLLLVADDSRAQQIVAAHMLEALGYRVQVVANGREAVAAFRSSHHLAVLMDLVMPVMDGFDAARAIRRREGPGQHTPIIAVSQETDPEQQERARKAGMDGFLTKPVGPDELKQVLERCLDEPKRP